MQKVRYGARISSLGGPSRQKVRHGNHSNLLWELRRPKIIPRWFRWCNLYVAAAKSNCPKMRCCNVIVWGQMVLIGQSSMRGDDVLHEPLSWKHRTPLRAPFQITSGDKSHSSKIGELPIVVRSGNWSDILLKLMGEECSSEPRP